MNKKLLSVLFLLVAAVCLVFTLGVASASTAVLVTENAYFRGEYANLLGGESDVGTEAVIIFGQVTGEEATDTYGIALFDRGATEPMGYFEAKGKAEDGKFGIAIAHSTFANTGLYVAKTYVKSEAGGYTYADTSVTFGTADVVVHTAEEFLALDGTVDGVKVELANDIDLTGATIKEITAQVSNYKNLIGAIQKNHVLISTFKGDLNGHGYKVTARMVNADKDSTIYMGGIFGMISSSLIQNVQFDIEVVYPIHSGNGERASLLCMEMYGSDVRNCYVKGVFNCLGAANRSPVQGYFHTSHIYNTVYDIKAYNNGTYTEQDGYTGGTQDTSKGALVWEVNQANSTSFNNCVIMSGNLSGTQKATACVTLDDKAAVINAVQTATPFDTTRGAELWTVVEDHLYLDGVLVF